MSLPSLPPVAGTDPARSVLDSFRISIAKRVAEALPPLTIEQVYSGVDYGKKGVDFERLPARTCKVKHGISGGSVHSYAQANFRSVVHEVGECERLALLLGSDIPQEASDRDFRVAVDGSHVEVHHFQPVLVDQSVDQMSSSLVGGNGCMQIRNVISVRSCPTASRELRRLVEQEFPDAVFVKSALGDDFEAHSHSAFFVQSSAVGRH